jgi:N-carbamoylputrescine amidase
MSTPMNVTVCQLDSRAERRGAALAALAEHVTRHRTDLLVLPELPFSTWLASEPVPDLARWQHSVEEHVTAIAGLATLGAAAIIASRPTVEVNGSRCNQAFLWTAPTGAVRIRDKYYLPDEPGYWEASWYDRGELSFNTCRVGAARVGVQLCTDLWFFEGARHYARSGVEVLCVPRATPFESLPKWLAGGQVAAVCSGAYTLSSNQWIPSGTGGLSGGHAWVIDPDGTVLASTSPDEPFVTVEIDLDLARQAKTTYPRYVHE